MESVIAPGVIESAQLAISLLAVVQAECAKLYKLLHEGKISDGTRRMLEHELDLQEAKMVRE